MRRDPRLLSNPRYRDHPAPRLTFSVSERSPTENQYTMTLTFTVQLEREYPLAQVQFMEHSGVAYFR